MMTDNQIVSDIAIPPGEYLLEVLHEVQITQSELAARMSRPPQAINEIIKGEKAITAETAIQLEMVLNIPRHIWSSLEAEYRLTKASILEKEKLQEEASLIEKFPYKDLVKLKLVPRVSSKTEKVCNLRKYFRVSSLYNISSLSELRPAFRKNTNGNELNNYALASWLKSAELLAKNKECDKFSKKNLKDSFNEIRKLTLLESPNEIYQNLDEILRRSGVALVLIPHFPKTHVTGATFWISKRKAVVVMSLRGAWADIFWFSLFHELGHIILHSHKDIFIEEDEIDYHRNLKEKEADEFAQDVLIPSKCFVDFKNIGDFTRVNIKNFAQEQGISPGIVTGRLQHEGLISYKNNFGRSKFNWKNFNFEHSS